MSSSALAHDGHHHEAATWTFNPSLLALVCVSTALYIFGVRRLWQRAGRGRGIRGRHTLSFAGAWITLVIALMSPIDPLSDTSFAAHMSQHELIMLVAAPLFVLGRPALGYFWALPDSARRRVGRVVRLRPLRATWTFISHPMIALLLHGAIRWAWHAPVLHEAALHNELVHGVQHATFFFSAALFWWALVQGRYGRLGYGLAVLFVFATAAHTGLLGAMLTLSRDVWYATYAARSSTPLEDQQLAGLIMWVPAGVLFTCIGLALFAAWLGEAKRRAKTTRVAALVGAALLFMACGDSRTERVARDLTRGDPLKGEIAIQKYGCGSCHTIPGVPGAKGAVGPSLAKFAKRSHIAGRYPNHADNLVQWMMHPQSLDPGVIMPDMGVTESDARDIAAYLYTLYYR